MCRWRSKAACATRLRRWPAARAAMPVTPAKSRAMLLRAGELGQDFGQGRDVSVPFEQRRTRRPAHRRSIELPHGVRHRLIMGVDENPARIAAMTGDVHLQDARKVDRGQVLFRRKAMILARNVDVVHVEHEMTAGTL